MTKERLTSNQVLQAIKTRIITTEYKPGHILNESDIAEEFSISRTPVREVFKRLETEKYIVLIPRVGAQVAVVDFKFIRECFDLKIALESLCASKAAISENKEREIVILESVLERLKTYKGHESYSKIIIDDHIFHKTVRAMAGNTLVEEVLDQYHGHLERLWYLQTNKIQNVKIFVDTLSEILEAIKAHDSIRAATAAEKHLQSYIDQVRNELFK